MGTPFDGISNGLIGAAIFVWVLRPLLRFANRKWSDQDRDANYFKLAARK